MKVGANVRNSGAGMDFRTGDEAAMGLEDAVIEGEAAPAAAEAKAPAKKGTKKPEGAAMDMEKSDPGSEMLVETAAVASMAEAVKAAASADSGDSKGVRARRFAVVPDPSRDALLTDFGKDTLTDRYLM